MYVTGRIPSVLCAKDFKVIARNFAEGLEAGLDPLVWMEIVGVDRFKKLMCFKRNSKHCGLLVLF